LIVIKASEFATKYLTRFLGARMVARGDVAGLPHHTFDVLNDAAPAGVELSRQVID
jgi:hypothetical protein